MGLLLIALLSTTAYAGAQASLAATAPAPTPRSATPAPAPVRTPGPPAPGPAWAVAGPTPRLAWTAKVLYPTPARPAPSVGGSEAGGGPAPGGGAGGAAGGRGSTIVSPVSAWGTPTELLVLGSRVDASGHPWLRVRLDDRPNRVVAWIDADDTVVHSDRWRISVSRARRRVLVYHADRLMRAFAAVVGAPATPTPAGLFAVAAELRQPDSGEFQGSWVLPLTAHSRVLLRFDGGDGQIALHGRGGASLADPLGSARSHGCVRVSNAAIGWIATHVPVGTPVAVD